LTSLGLLPGPYCFYEKGRKGLAEEIEKAYCIDPLISDENFLAENLSTMKKEVGIPE
jgi:hypothetical protein